MRAGTVFKLGFKENYIYLDVFAFSDVLEKIINIVKDIIISINDTKLNESYHIYKDYALENLANFCNENYKNILKYEFYKQASIKDEMNFPPVYNIYFFPQKEFLNVANVDDELIKSIVFPVMKVYILGYYEKNQVENLFNLHKEHFKKENFIFTLEKAYYDILGNPIVNGDEFVRYITSRQNLTKTVIIDNATRILNNKKNVFMNFVQFSDNNRILVEIFGRIIENFRKNQMLEIINQKIIYLRIYFNETYNTKDIIEYMKKKVSDSKKSMMEPLDVIGGRFYYLIRNYENEYTKTPNNLEDAALVMSYNQIYNRTEVYNYPIDPDNYDEFIKTINSFFEQSKYYCEFSE